MSEDNSPLRPARELATLAGEVMKAAKENADAREAGANAAKTLNVLSKSLYNLLMPLRVLNFYAAKVDNYFTNKFGDELGAKLADVPPEDITEPKSFIAGPAIQGIADTVDEDDLREMYINLLAKAMDRREVSLVHPAFVDILRQIDAAELKSLTAVLRQELLTIAEIRVTKPDGNWRTYLRDMVSIIHIKGDPTADQMERVTSWTDNWRRLGLITTHYDLKSTAIDAYNWVESRAEWESAKVDLPADCTLTYAPGLLARTAFGARFAHAVGMHDNNP